MALTLARGRGTIEGMKKLLPLATILVACTSQITGGDDDDGGLVDDSGASVFDADPSAVDAAPAAVDAATAGPDADTRIAAGATCDVIESIEQGDRCAEGTTCRISDPSGVGRCWPVGELPVGADCPHQPLLYWISPCGPGMACEEGQCAAICNLDVYTSGCTCMQVIMDSNIGLCG